MDSPENQENKSLAEAARGAYRRLSEKTRASFLKKVAHSRAVTIRQIMRLARVPHSFPPERVDRWMKSDHQSRIEQVILSPEHEDLFDRLLRGFFCGAHPSLNDRLLKLIDPAEARPKAFNEALEQVARDFSTDSYLELFVAATKWVCRDVIKAHEQLLASRQSEAEEELPGPRQAVCADPPVGTPAAMPTQSPQEPAKLSDLDQALNTVEESVKLLRSVRAADTAQAAAAIARAGETVTALSAELKTLASAGGEAYPSWSTREEFVACWKRLSEVADRRHREREQSVAQIYELARLLESVEAHHRFPRRQNELTEMARRAAAELRQLDPANCALPDGGSRLALEWLEWAWSQDGAGAEELQQQVQKLSPSLAELLCELNWSDLRWSATGQAAEPKASPQARVPQSERQSGASNQTTAERTQVSRDTPTEQVAPPDQPATVSLSSRESPQSSSKVRTEPVTTTTERIAVAPPQTPLSKPQSAETTHAPVVDIATAAEVHVVKLPLEQAAPRLEARTINEGEEVVKVVWRLASEGRWGLAGHLAAVVSTHLIPPPWVFEVAALGPRVNYEVSPMSQRLANLFAKTAEINLDSLSADAQGATRLLLVGASLRPALLAPQTWAATVLRWVEVREHLRLPKLDALALAVEQFSLLGQPLRLEMMHSSQSQAEWEQQVAAVRAEVHGWLAKAPHYGFNYAPAAQVWRHLLGQSGRLRRLMEAVENAQPSGVADLRTQLAPWTTDATAQVRVARNELNLRRSIEGTARVKLYANIAEAEDLANRVLALLTRAPSRSDNFQDERVERLFAMFRENFNAAGQELRELLSHQATDALRAAVGLCERTLADAQRLLDGRLPAAGGDEPDPCWLLDAELLRDPAWKLSPEGSLEAPTIADSERLLELARTAPDWADTWTRQVAAENHLATAGLLESFRWQPPVGLNPAELEQDRRRELETCRARLEREADRARSMLEEFVGLGLCRQRDYDDWSGQLESVKRDGETACHFEALYKRLAELRTKIRKQLDTATVEIRGWLDNDKSVSPRARETILALLDKGDIHTAFDYRERISEGRPLPETVEPPLLFEAFFGVNGWLSKSEEALQEAGFVELSQAARDGAVWHSLDFQFLGSEQRERAVAELRLWFDLERKGAAEAKEVQQLALALGLQPHQSGIRAVSGIRGGYSIWEIRTDLLNSRNLSLVPAFGSLAGGRYRLHLMFGAPDIETLVSKCAAEPGETSAHIVLCFQPLRLRERRELADLARKQVFRPAVVDRGLFAFICAQPSARLATLLRCALPFTHVEPFAVAAGSVLPPEMFFGRMREKSSLEDPLGSCFVYGGRQLGKTALLRAVERSFHRPAQGSAAVWLDLKNELSSRGRPMDDFWNVVGARLKEAHVLDDKARPTTAEGLFKHIKNWLGTDAQRRLLLLLDEADLFLEQDGKETENHEPFPRCQRLKGLMDETERRFKVVFAGLHNVQRTTRVSNHPLAHYGEAICIGPMLAEAESRAARELVESPLGYAGYRFESPEGVSRILALTNYYPSLIQLFCHHLLRDLRENHVARFSDWRTTPPCVITSQHVQFAYTSRVRRAIHEKVKLTLDLDRRYELIAYLLAFYHLNQSGSDGIELRDIWDHASAYWPKGFEDLRTVDEFRGLIEEMVGLGILRHVSGTHRYALRNPNVIMLLGTEDEIIRQLEVARNWEPALKYHSDKFRRVLVETPKLLLSPLTAHQEGDIKGPQNRVVVLYGTTASGLADVPRAMESLFGKERTVVLRNWVDAPALADRIASLERPAGTHTVLVVPAEAPWDETWVAAATQRLTQFVSPSAFLTVLFTADPLRAQVLVNGLESANEIGVREVILRPWHDAAVRQWLESEPHRIPAAQQPALRQRISELTGNWPVLLARLNPADVRELERTCTEIEQLHTNSEDVARLRVQFGVEDEPAGSTLRVAAELGTFSVEELCEFFGATSAQARQALASRVAWAQRLNLVTVAGGALAFDPIVARLLKFPTQT